MKGTFAAGVAGVVVGAGLVLLTSRAIPGPRPAAAAPAAPGGPAAAARVPSGWDARYLARLSTLEGKVDELAAKPPAERAAASDDDPRAKDLADQYQRSLEALEQTLRQHDAEPIDGSWAPAQAASMRTELTALTPTEHAFKVEGVDCRDKTCVAELLYDTPDDALEGRGAIREARLKGCHGMESTLAPPTAPGPYRTRLIYDCR